MLRIFAKMVDLTVAMKKIEIGGYSYRKTAFLDLLVES